MHILKLFALSCWLSCVKGCEIFCSRNYRPVCGFDGSCYTEARNSCFMKNINCGRKLKKSPVFKDIRPGPCKKSLVLCKLFPEDELKP
ncbi:hypothetical protein M5D96_008866 [Drosophila gunungcola]|uniref:Kazal-like domain-containing protein n=1 Tax=Drosophila gunungcola TaxID=103775 RepID=A0A9Q0BMQ9_9MUSC|nr:hypothetical protein M5D96_008866 [Drosophila gunungcola]